MPALDITQSAAQAVLRSFLLSVLPPNTDVIESQDNRVPEPSNPNFVAMTAIRRVRLETNIDSYADAVFTGFIGGSTLSVSNVEYGSLQIGSPVFFPGVEAGTIIIGLDSGQGGTGTYTVSPAQNVPSQTMAGGTANLMQPTEVVYQLDVHSNAVTTAADMAQAISTAFRDEYAVDFFSAQNPGVAPLHADEPRQIPFINAEEQWESRWIIEAHMQVNPSLMFPQQFADVLTIQSQSVDDLPIIVSLGTIVSAAANTKLILPIDVPKGTVIVVMISTQTNLTASITDSAGNIYSGLAVGFSTPGYCGLLSAINLADMPAGSFIDVTMPSNPVPPPIVVSALMIVGSSGNADVIVEGGGTSTNPSLITDAPLGAGDVLIAVIGTSGAIGTFQQSLGWGQIPGAANLTIPGLVGGFLVNIEDQSSQTYAPLFSNPVEWWGILISFTAP